MIPFTLILSYLIGSISFALLIGKVFFRIDIRKHGSGNLGGTNASRVLGKGPGAVVMAGDFLKGTLAASLPILLDVDISPFITGSFAILGHCYPIFAEFKGGKAVATTAGMTAFITPIGFLVGMLTFIITLKATKFVSLSSITASMVIFIYSLTMDWVTILFSGLLSFFIIYRHRENLKRIHNNTEPKIKWLK